MEEGKVNSFFKIYIYIKKLQQGLSFFEGWIGTKFGGIPHPMKISKINNFQLALWRPIDFIWGTHYPKKKAL
jgi:hypothetical protein